MVSALGLAIASCGVSRHIPEDKYLVKRVIIEDSAKNVREQRTMTSELERYIQQSPNKRFFGTNFYLWTYYATNQEKDNWWNRLKQKISQEPVYYDESKSIKSAENLKIYMNALGYYASESTFKVDTLKKNRVAVRYITKQGRPYIINKLSYDLQDSLLAPILLPDTISSLIKVGMPFSVASLDKERERIMSTLRQNGYYDFVVGNIEYLADTLARNYTVDLTMIVKRNIDGYDQRGNPIMANNKRYIVDKVYILPNYEPTLMASDTSYLSKIDTTFFRGINIIHNQDEQTNVREKVLRQAVSISPYSYYDSKMVENTYKNIMSIGYFKSARISFSPKSESESDIFASSPIDQSYVDSTIITGSPTSYLTSTIYCTPSLRQSFNIELEGSTTSSFYGLTTTVGYQNRNIFRGAESWDIDFTLGYEHMKAPDAIKKRATEIGISTSLSFPRFQFPFLGSSFPAIIQPRTKAELAVSFQDRPYYSRTISSASLAYTWRNKRNSSFMLSPVDINIIKMDYIDEDFYNDLENEYLKNSYEPQVVAGLSTSYTYTSKRTKPNSSITSLRLNGETAGNSINALEALFTGEKQADERYEIFGTHYAQYARADMNLSHNIPVGARSAIVGRIFCGAGLAYGSSTSIPYDRLFYAGGSNSMRGWTPRTLGPGSVAEPTDVVYPSQVGDMRLEANLEYRFPIWQSLHGATFVDVGNVWYIRDDESLYEPEAVFFFDTFYKQLGFNTGVGLRFDIQFAILRLDWGLQIHNPNKAEGSRWVKTFRWDNTALNFGVGYPF